MVSHWGFFLNTSWGSSHAIGQIRRLKAALFSPDWCRSIGSTGVDWGHFHSQLKVAVGDFKNPATAVGPSATHLLVCGCDITKYQPSSAASHIDDTTDWFLMFLHMCMSRACFIWNNCIFCLERISAFGCLSKETSWHPCTLTTHRSCHNYYHVTQLDETPCGWCPSPLWSLVFSNLTCKACWSLADFTFALTCLAPYSFICHFLFSFYFPFFGLSYFVLLFLNFFV